jgi:hypothetical protein
LASSVAFAILLTVPCPARAFEEQSTKEYEIRLAAHRRELLQRESDLDAARVEIRALKKRVDVRVKPAAVLEPPPPVAAPVLPAVEPPSPDRVDEAAQTIIASLQRDLDVERDNRSTLEQELGRLSVEPRPLESIEPLRRSLESADAQILVLRQQALAEQRARESLEVDLERARQIAGIEPSAEWVDRFATTMKERREQAMRLEQRLGEAHETIVALKGRLEATPAGSDPKLISGLEDENSKLRSALAATEQANADLQTQAELAAHLAEMLYGQPQ